VGHRDARRRGVPHPLVQDPARLAGVASIGVDETSFLAANRFHHTEFITGIVALPGPGRPSAQLLDVIPGRTKAAVQQWISARPPKWREQVTMCSLDPFRGYATALSTSLPHAVRVLDAFHVVRLGLAAVDDVWRRVQQQTLGRRGHRDDPLYRGRRADAKHRLWKILNRCARSETPELLRLARTLDAWQGELLAAFNATRRCPASNSPTEAVNMLIKKIKRIGHGFRNLANYRLRLLLAVGLDWRTVHRHTAPPLHQRPLTTRGGVEPQNGRLATGFSSRFSIRDVPDTARPVVPCGRVPPLIAGLGTSSRAARDSAPAAEP